MLLCSAIREWEFLFCVSLCGKCTCCLVSVRIILLRTVVTHPNKPAQQKERKKCKFFPFFLPTLKTLKYLWSKIGKKKWGQSFVNIWLPSLFFANFTAMKDEKYFSFKHFYKDSTLEVYTIYYNYKQAKMCRKNETHVTLLFPFTFLP